MLTFSGVPTENKVKEATVCFDWLQYIGRLCQFLIWAIKAALAVCLCVCHTHAFCMCVCVTENEFVHV